MAEDSRENFEILVAGILSAAAVVGLGFVAVWLFPHLDWKYWDPWFDLAWKTVLIFGYLGYIVRRHLRQSRFLLVFVLLLCAHCTTFVHVIHSGIRIQRGYGLLLLMGEFLLFSWILMAVSRMLRAEQS